MNQITRLLTLEEICTRVAEGNVTPEITLKAFNLQSKKKQGQIRAKEDPAAIREVRARVRRKSVEE